MKWYRKINRGFAAAVLLILAIVAWRIVLAGQRGRETARIETFVQDYLNTAVSLEFVTAEMLEDYRAAEMPFAEYKEKDGDYIAWREDAKELLEPFFPEDGRYLQFAVNRTELKWQEMLESGRAEAWTHNFQNLQRLNWIDDTVTADIMVEYVPPVPRGTMYTHQEQIHLQKIGSEWKIIASDLKTNSVGGGGEWY